VLCWRLFISGCLLSWHLQKHMLVLLKARFRTRVKGKEEWSVPESLRLRQQQLALLLLH
jgi:hypothetical protein